MGPENAGISVATVARTELGPACQEWGVPVAVQHAVTEPNQMVLAMAKLLSLVLGQYGFLGWGLPWEGAVPAAEVGWGEQLGQLQLLLMFAWKLDFEITLIFCCLNFWFCCCCWNIWLSDILEFFSLNKTNFENKKNLSIHWFFKTFFLPIFKFSPFPLYNFLKHIFLTVQY